MAVKTLSAVDRLSDALMGGAIGHFGLETSYDVISKFIHAHVFAWRNEAKIQLQEIRDSSSIAAEMAYPDYAHEIDYIEATCSHAAVGALAPLYERLFHIAAQHLRSAYGLSQRIEHRRAVAMEDQFWNPKVFVERNKSISPENLAHGIVQLLDAIGCSECIVGENKKLVEAMFFYRNCAMHKSYLWSPDEVRAFAKYVTENKWSEWFEIAPAPNENSWPTIMSDSFIKKCLDEFGPVADGLRKAERKLIESGLSNKEMA